MVRDRTQPLLGCRVLVVEDEYFLADDLSLELEAHGAKVIGPVNNLSDALALIERDGFDVAIVDIDLHNEMAFILGDALARQNIPFLFATGYSAEVIPARFEHVIRWEKPYVARQLLEDVGRLCIRKQAPTGETA
jgi:DNA-binding response OmpR family regulator